MLVADIEELGKLDVSEIHARRPNAKEVLTSKKGVIFLTNLSSELDKCAND